MPQYSKFEFEDLIMTDFYKLLNNLQLPQIHRSHGKEYYVDPFRERLILKTPEETVRQQVLQYLLSCKNIPKEMIQVEMRLSKYHVNSARRADIIVERFNGNKGELSPLAIIECKAPEIMIGDSAIQQAIDYADENPCMVLCLSFPLPNPENRVSNVTPPILLTPLEVAAHLHVSEKTAVRIMQELPHFNLRP